MGNNSNNNKSNNTTKKQHKLRGKVLRHTQHKIGISGNIP